MGMNTGQSVPQEVTPMEMAYKIIEQENLMLRDNIRELEEKLQDSIQQTHRETEQYQYQLLDEQTKCKQTIEEAKQNLYEMQRRWAAEKERADGLQKQLSAEQAAAAKLRQDISTGQKNEKVMRESRDMEKLRADELQKQCKTEKARADKLQTNLDAEKKTASELRLKANQQIQKQKEIVKYQEEIAQAENTVRNLQTELAAKRKKIKGQAAVFGLLLIIACLPSIYFYFQAEECRSKNWSLSQQADRLRGEVAALTKDMESLQEVYDSMEEESASLKEDYDALMEKSSALEAKNGTLSKTLISLNEEFTALSEEVITLKADYQIIQPEYEFYHKNAVIVYSDDTKLYHQYGCSRGENKSFWIFNLEFAISRDYMPCPACLSEASKYPYLLY